MVFIITASLPPPTVMTVRARAGGPSGRAFTRALNNIRSVSLLVPASPTSPQPVNYFFTLNTNTDEGRQTVSIN